MKFRTRVLPVALMIGAALAGNAFAEVVKIAQIDPFTGPAAGINENNVHMLQYAISIANKEHWAGPNVTFQDVPFVPVGQWMVPTAHRKDLTGFVKCGFMLFWGVKRV